MTTEQASQLSTLYNQYILHEGDKVLLWTNNSPTSSFAQQTITISGGFSSYRYLIIECYQQSNDSSVQTDSNGNTQYNLRSVDATTFWMSAGGNYIRQATISKTNGTIAFGIGYSPTASTNTACIPAKIYGI